MKYPEYIEVGDKRYKINTDFRIAIRCNQITQDNSINDIERTMAVIYLLFGEEALKDTTDYEQLSKLATKYLCCGKEFEISNEEPDMDFEQDMDYIEASFMSDYHIDLSTTQMHWWKFYNLISGLSNSEMGNCCILNRIRNIRTMDTKDIKDAKEKKQIMDAKKHFALKKKEIELTEEQIKSIQELDKALGL